MYPSKRHVKKIISSNYPQHQQSEPVSELFSDDRLLDSKCSGSSVAALDRVNEQDSKGQVIESVEEHTERENGSYDLQFTNGSWTRRERYMAEQLLRELQK
jgi:hypothetical protein